MKPPMPYFGGKATLAPAIACLLPAHEHYVEPYAGSLAVLLAKRPAAMETVNDLDGDLILFWRMLRDHPDELERLATLTPHARAEHAAAYDLEAPTDLERARRVWVQLTQGRAGVRTRTGWRHCIDPAGSSASMPRYLRGYVQRIGPAVARLAEVSLESRPALEIVAKYGAEPDVLLYVDPPYLGETRQSGGYVHEMRGEADHRQLLAALLEARSAVVLSGYASPLYDQTLVGWGPPHHGRRYWAVRRMGLAGRGAVVQPPAGRSAGAVRTGGAPVTGQALVLRGDARSLPLADESVDLIVTSPPFYALRSYSDGGEHYAGQIGSEPTPAEYIAALIECTAEWVRVLKPTGSLFVDLGDKYNSAASGQNGTGATTLDPSRGPKLYRSARGQSTQTARPKSLLGLPWRYALACMDDLGLILRAEIVWQKPNGLPESVTDRVRRSHETWFHFVRQPRYYAAVDEIREPYEPDSAERRGRYGNNPGRDGLAGLRATGGPRHGSSGVSAMGVGGSTLNPLGKLPGSVWSIPSESLRVPEHLGIDHYAAFPLALPLRIIAGWSPPGICTACGEGRRPRTTRGITDYACDCPEPTAPTRPSVVLDPFAGTGTTMLAAKALGRIGIGVDRSADYCRLAAWRTTDPGELAKAMRVEKPPTQVDGQGTLFDLGGVLR